MSVHDAPPALDDLDFGTDSELMTPSAGQAPASNGTPAVAVEISVGDSYDFLAKEEETSSAEVSDTEAPDTEEVGIELAVASPNESMSIDIELDVGTHASVEQVAPPPLQMQMQEQKSSDDFATVLSQVPGPAQAVAEQKASPQPIVSTSFDETNAGVTNTQSVRFPGTNIRRELPNSNSGSSTSARIKGVLLGLGIAGAATFAASDYLMPLVFEAKELEAAQSIPLSPTFKPVESLYKKTIKASVTPIPALNHSYLQAIDTAIVSANPAQAAKKFETSLLGPLAPQERQTAAELTARFYLLTGRGQQAVDVLSPWCKNITKSNLSSCLVLTRALISSKNFQRAGSMIRALNSDETTLGQAHSTVQLLSAAHGALSSPSQKNLRELLDQMITQNDLSSEWSWQRSVWIARGMMQIPKHERMALSSYLFAEKRAAITTALIAAANSKQLKTDPLLVPFLNYFAVEYENVPLRLTLLPAGRADSDLRFLGTIFQILSSAFTEPSRLVQGQMQPIVGQPFYGELVRIINTNLAIYDGDWQTVYQQIRSINGRYGLFPLEWHLIQGRYALQTHSIENWKNALSGLRLLERTDPQVRREFAYWHVRSGLERLLAEDWLTSHEKARTLAMTPNEKGIIAADEGIKIKQSGDLKSAAEFLLKMHQQIPWHSFLMQTTVEVIGQAGADPADIISKQANIPEQYLRRGSEVRLLTDATILKILERM